MSYSTAATAPLLNCCFYELHNGELSDINTTISIDCGPCVRISSLPVCIEGWEPLCCHTCSTWVVSSVNIAIMCKYFTPCKSALCSDNKLCNTCSKLIYSKLISSNEFLSGIMSDHGQFPSPFQEFIPKLKNIFNE